MDQLEQQTTAWRQFRQTRIGSSDASVIMKQSKWSTPHKLWQEKTGRLPLEQKTNFAIERGNRWEPAARARYELKTGFELPPTIKIHPRYKFLIASLDGFSEEQQVVLEIKCFTSTSNFEMVKSGKVPDVYWPQVQHQLMVTGAKSVHFFCCLIGKVGMTEQILDDALIEVQPDEAYQKELLLEEINFYNCMQQDIAPPLTEADYLEAEDQSTVLLFSKLKRLKLDVQRKQKMVSKLLEEIDLLDGDFDELKEEAVEHCETLGHSKISSVGVKMVKTKAGHWQVRLADEVEGE